MSLAKLVIGDTVVITDSNHPASRRKIIAIGRKYFTVSGGEQFDKVTGRINDRWGHRHLMTAKAYALAKRGDESRETLRSFGVDVHRCDDKKAIAIADALAPLMAAELYAVNPKASASK